MTESTPTDPDAVANSQPVDALAATGAATGEAVSPTTVTPVEGDTLVGSGQAPASPILGEGDAPVNPNAPADDVLSNSSDVVGGPVVIDAAEAAELPVPPQQFEGTMSIEDRLAENAEVAQVQEANAAESAPVALAQAQEDLDFRTKNPDSPVVRAANPAVGGEAFY